MKEIIFQFDKLANTNWQIQRAMKSLTDIEKLLISKKAMLFRKYPIKSLAIFGSYARNEQQEESDLDLLVEFDGKIGSNFILLADELEELLGFKVDLVSKKGIKPHYFEHIKEDIIYV